MVLTPADVANKQFRNSFRGYNEDEVDSFLDAVEAELVRLLTENTALRVRVEEFERKRPGGLNGGSAIADGSAATVGPVTGAPAAGSGDLPKGPAASFFAGDRLESTRDLTGDRPADSGPSSSTAAPSASTAGQAAVSAEPPPPPTAGRTEEAALRTLLLAQRTADAAIEEARAEAEQLLRSAQEQSAQLDQEAQSRQQRVLGALETRRRQLEKHIEDLRAYEREYRSRLRAYLEAQLRELNGQVVGAPGSLPAAPGDTAAPLSPSDGASRPAGAAPPAEGGPGLSDRPGDGQSAPDRPGPDRPGPDPTGREGTADRSSPPPEASAAVSAAAPAVAPAAAPTGPPTTPVGPPQQANPFRPGPTAADFAQPGPELPPDSTDGR